MASCTVQSQKLGSKEKFWRQRGDGTRNDVPSSNPTIYRGSFHGNGTRRMTVGRNVSQTTRTRAALRV